MDLEDLEGEGSIRWLKRSANHGYNEAQWALGNLYVHGDESAGVGVRASAKNNYPI